MRNLLFACVVALVFCPMAIASDIAISTQAGWMGQAHADNEVQEIVNNVKGVSVEVFTSTQLDALATWVQDHTGDGTPDLLIMFGNFPATIYPAGNAQPNGSIAEAFLDDGNCIVNTGDYIFYVGSAGNNNAGGLQNMMDVPAAAMWGDDSFATTFTPTADGQLYTPSLTTLPSNRPWFPAQFAGTDWEFELILAQNADGSQAHPAILHNTVTDGRVGVFFQIGQNTDSYARGEVISEWINNWFLTLVASGNPFARSPSPKGGTKIEQTWVNLSWNPGDFAVSHNVYVGESFDDVNDATTASPAYQGNYTDDYILAGFFGYPYPNGLVPGTTYYWRIDEVNDADPNSPWKGKVWSFWIPPTNAYQPSPADGVPYVDTGVKLSWAVGLNAKVHYIFFGDNFDDVNNAPVGTGSSVSGTTYTPGALERGKTYYWRVDEFNPPATSKGEVWSFTTLPNVPLGDPNLVAWWKLDEGAGTTVVDWSGHENHGTFKGDPEWTNGHDGGAIDLDGAGDYIDFTGTSDLPAGTSARTLCGWGKTNSIAGGYRWIAAYGTASTSQAMFVGMLGADLIGGGYGGDDVTASGFWEVDVWHHICLTYDGATARLYADGILLGSETKSWNLPLSRAHIGRQVNNAAEYWNGQVDDVRIYNRVLTPQEIQQVMRGDTTRAWNASPADGSISDVVRAASLNWSPGDAASQHAVYFGTDRDAVISASTSDTTGVFRGLQAGTSYTPPEGVPRDSGPYYWRIDEHNNGGTVTKGGVWNFVVADYILVDDFEAYNDVESGQPGSNLIYEAWLDGYGTTNNGSYAGYIVPFEPTMESDTVHGGRQSAPMGYSNTTATMSEITRTFTPAQNWTANDIQTLSIWFNGDSANVPGQLYVKINGVQVLYDGDAANLTIPAWQVCNIDLSKVGTNLASVTSLTVGVQGFGATGVLLLDDFRLYPYPRELITPVQPDPTGLVASFAFDGNANDSSGNGHHGTESDVLAYVAGMDGQAVQLDGIDDFVDFGNPAGWPSGRAPRSLCGWGLTSSVAPGWRWLAAYGRAGTSQAMFIGLNGAALYGGGYGDDVLLSGFWDVDVWHHICLTYDGTTARLYADGVEVAVSAKNWNLILDRAHVGRQVNDAAEFWEGLVDDVRVYDRVLDQEEILWLAGGTTPIHKPF